MELPNPSIARLLRLEHIPLESVIFALELAARTFAFIDFVERPPGQPTVQTDQVLHTAPSASEHSVVRILSPLHYSMSNINFYKLVKNQKKYHNPGYKKHAIEIPFRMAVIGPSGSMKTNSALNILKAMNGTFERVVVCCKSSCEPLYDLLRSKIPSNALSFYEGGEIPDINDFKEAGQTLIIFDDLVLERDQSGISEFFIRGRKVGDGISLMYLSQSYYDIPKIIRRQCNYSILKQLPDKRDLHAILSEWSLGIDKFTLEKLYTRALQAQEDFFLIDNATRDRKLKFRRNLTPLSYVEQQTDSAQLIDSAQPISQTSGVSPTLGWEPTSRSFNNSRNFNKKDAIPGDGLVCECGKVLKHRSSLPRHLESRAHKRLT